MDGRTAVEQLSPPTDAAMDPFDAPVTTRDLRRYV